MPAPHKPAAKSPRVPIKNAATLLVAAALFVAGMWHFGLPPYHPGGSSAPQTTAGTAAPVPPMDRSRVILRNGGAPETDPKRREEERLVNRHFEAKYPGWTLRYDTWQFSQDSFFAKFIGGTLPDVIGLFATEATEILDRKLSADITQELEEWHLYSELNSRMMGLISRDGRIYGMPVGGANMGFYVMTLFYNKPMLKEAGLTDAAGEVIPPDTWEDFTTYALHLTNREKGVAGFGILGETGASGWHFLNWVWQSGGDFERQAPDGKWVSVFHEPEAVRALQFIKDLRWKHDVLQRNVLCNNDDLFELFSTNRIAMAIFTPEYLVYLVDKYGMDPDTIGISLLPRGPGGRANQVGGAFQIINAKLEGEKKKRAVQSLLMEHDLDLVEARLKLTSEQGRRIGIPAIPIFKSSYQEKLDAIVDKYRNLPDLSGLLLEAADAVRLEPPYKSQQLYNLYLSPAIQEVLVNAEAAPAALLEKASLRFQSRELDKVNDALAKARPSTAPAVP